MSRVGFIGLGIMGKPMAKNLLKAGIDLMVCDLNDQAVKEVVECGAQASSYREISAILFFLFYQMVIFQKVYYLMKAVWHRL